MPVPLAALPAVASLLAVAALLALAPPLAVAVAGLVGPSAGTYNRTVANSALALVQQHKYPERGNTDYKLVMVFQIYPSL